MDYYVIKALHIISVISWLVGLLYLPRLYVYHKQILENNLKDQTCIDMFCVMEKRLLHYIMTPAMAMSWCFGGYLFIFYVGFEPIWFHIKFFFIILLSAYHISLGIYRKQLYDKSCRKSVRFFKIFNEVPTILMIFIVFFAVLKPF